MAECCPSSCSRPTLQIVQRTLDQHAKAITALLLPDLARA